MNYVYQRVGISAKYFPHIANSNALIDNKYIPETSRRKFFGICNVPKIWQHMESMMSNFALRQSSKTKQLDYKEYFPFRKVK